MKLLLLVALCVFSARAQDPVCTACPSCVPGPNPDFPLPDDVGCSAKVVFILDESGSLLSFRDDVVNAAKEFWTGLSTLNGFGGSAQLGLIEFAAEARLVQPVLRPLDQAYVNELNAYIDTGRGGVEGYSPSGTTDWGEALALANTAFTGDNTPDIIVFFTDGEPNGHDGDCDAECYPFDENNGDLGQACYQADLIKARGIKIFTVAVGGVVGNLPAIQVISGGSTTSVPFGAGATAWDLAPESFGAADYVVDAQVTNLGQKLQAVATALCRPPCDACAILPTNNNPGDLECVSPDAPSNLLDITIASTGVCGTASFGTRVTGFDSACREGTITKTVTVPDECDNESVRTEEYTTFVHDTTAPTVECPSSIESFGSCADALEAITNLNLVATDTCSTVFVDKSAVVSDFDQTDVAGYTVTFDAFDACNNHADLCTVRYGCSDGADLELVKTSDIEDCVIAGDAAGVTYTITVTNKGPAVSRNVEVVENFPPGGMYEQRGEINPSVGDINDLTDVGFVWAVGDLANGESATVSVRFVLDAGYPSGLIENHAIAQSTTTRDPELCNNEDTSVTRVCRKSDLSVTKTDNIDWVTAGELDNGVARVYAYEIEVTNHGPSIANNVRVSDTFPPAVPGADHPFVLGSRLQCDGGSCTPTATGFHCTMTTPVPVGQTRVILATYTVPASTPAGSYINNVVVASDSTDPVPENNAAQDETSVRTEADIGVSKDDEVLVVTAGDEVTYTYFIKVWNAGPSYAREVRLVDTWPFGLHQVEGSLAPSQGDCVPLGGGSFSCNFGSLGVASGVNEARVRVSYKVPASLSTCEVRNLVNVDSSTYDPRTCDNTAKDVNSVQERAQLSATITADTSSIALGDVTQYRYEIVVTNNGPSTARQATLNSLWPVQFTQFRETLESTQGGCVTTGGDFSCAFGDIPLGESVTVWVKFSVSELAEEGSFVQEIAAFSPTDTQCRSTAVAVNVVASQKKRAEEEEAHDINVAVEKQLIDATGLTKFTIVMSNPLDEPVTLEDIVLHVNDDEQWLLTHPDRKHHFSANNCGRLRGALLIERQLKCVFTLTEEVASTITKAAVQVKGVSISAGNKLVIDTTSSV